MSSNIIGSLIWIIFIFLSLFTHMIIKSLSGDVDFIITLFARFVYSLPILFILAYLARKKLFLQINNWKNIALRSLFWFCNYDNGFFLITTNPYRSYYCSCTEFCNICNSLVSFFFLGEKIGLIRWTAVFSGLIGVFLMINPISIIRETSSLSSFGIYLAFGSAVTHAMLAIVLRKIGKTEHPATTALIHNLATSFVIIVTIIFLGQSFLEKLVILE